MRAGEEQIHVAAVGDSITAGSPWDADPDRRLARGGRCRGSAAAFHRPCRLRQADGRDRAWVDEAAAGAEVLVVQGGINDIAQGRPVAAAAANLRAMIDRGLELGLRVAVADVLPWNNGWPAAEPRIRELNALIDGLGAPVLRFHETLEDPQRPGRMREEWTVEGDHPSVEGYRRLGELAFRLP